MLRVIEYFAKSLKVTQDHCNWYYSKLGYGFLFAFYGKHVSILYHFRDKARCWLKIAIFSYPLHSTPSLGAKEVPVGILPCRLAWKNQNGVPTRR